MNKAKIGLLLGMMCMLLTMGICIQIKTVNDSSTGVGKTQKENELRNSVLRWKEKYEKAFEKYNAAISFHSRYDETECPINDFIGLALYMRCTACFVYGKWSERSDALELMKESIEDVLNQLKRSSMSDRHGKMLKEYELTFLGIRDGWLERINFLLFLQEYIF